MKNELGKVIQIVFNKEINNSSGQKEEKMAQMIKIISLIIYLLFLTFVFEYINQL